MRYAMILVHDKAKSLANSISTSLRIAPPSRPVQQRYYLKHGLLARRIQKGLNNLDMLRQTTGFHPHGKTVLEFGTGSVGVDPVLWALLGARAIYTVDHVYQLGPALPTVVEHVEPYLAQMTPWVDGDMQILQQRLACLRQAKTAQTLLQQMRVTYLDFPEVLTCEFPPIDLFYSESNLQRIPLRQLDPLLHAVQRALSSTACSFHRIDCRDILVQALRHQHDARRWRLAYLQYPQWVWRLMCSERYNSQNRLRACQFVDMLRQIGLPPVYVETYTYRDDVSRCQTMRAAASFQHMRPEELAVSHARVVGLRGWNRPPMEQAFIVDGPGLHYPPSSWDPTHGLLIGEGYDD
jgi:hypothetical protein